MKIYWYRIDFRMADGYESSFHLIAENKADAYDRGRSRLLATTCGRGWEITAVTRTID